MQSAERIEKGISGQRSEVRRQKSEVRRQRSGVKLISDLRLLTSVIDDLNDLNDLTNQRIDELTI
ncbi:MAG: hypothetical protein V3U56_14805 [Syntrophobacteria bacterium]